MTKKHDDPFQNKADDSTNAITPTGIQRQVKEFIRSHERRRSQFPRAILVGLLTGLAGTCFRLSLAWIEPWRAHLAYSLRERGPWTILIMMAMGAASAAFVVTIVEQFAPEASGSGIPHVKAVLLHLRSMRWRRIMPVKFVGGVLGIGGGLALGREGPTIQMGGAVGQMVSEVLKVNPRERQTLVAAGAGAGLAAAFNAPLSGMVFVLEELQRDFSPAVFSMALVASVTADVVVRMATGQAPVFRVRQFPIPSMTLLPAFLVVGILAGLLGIVFNRALLAGLDLFKAVRRWPRGSAAAIVGALAGAVAWAVPDLAGGGYPLLAYAFTGSITGLTAMVYFAVRLSLTMLSYGTGAPGGIFAPLLVLGALLGLMVGQGVHLLFPHIPIYPAAFAVVGMGAYFSAIVRAPLTGIVLILEMTGRYGQILPLLLACLLAYGVADWLGDRPVYEALLERDLMRGQHVPQLRDTLLLDLTISRGAKFAGKAVKDLGLPAGCILITIYRGLDEQVPTANSILLEGDRITAVISPDAADAVSILHEGIEAG